MGYVFVLTLLVAAAGVNAATDYSTLPELDYNAWWGPEDKENDTSVRNLTITFDESTVEYLLYRLKNYREQKAALTDTFEYGVNPKVLKEYINEWASYNFAEREQALNQFQHRITTVQGLDIHFIEVTEENPDSKPVLPILMLHGWPGSVWEFHKVIPLMMEASKNTKYAFKLIIPSLPGYGFSDAAVIPGLGHVEAAILMRNLMHQLGHSTFGMQGGDFGAFICSNIATIFPTEVLFHHTNLAVSVTTSALQRFVVGAIYPPFVMNPDLAYRVYPLTDQIEWYAEHFGYFHMQAAEPDTLGVGMSDSPVGLLAWFLQAFSAGGSREGRFMSDGGLSQYDTTDLLDNIMFYWINNKMSTSFRLYAESFNLRNLNLGIHEIATPVPTCVIQAENEVFYTPAAMLNDKFTNLVNVTALNFGNHFLALQEPVVFTESVINCINQVFEEVHDEL